MAKLREARAYRRIKRPSTRKSRYKQLSYIKGVPMSKVTQYDSGDTEGKTHHVQVHLIAKKDINLRHNALEAARITATQYLTSSLVKEGFGLKIRAVPHNVLRENPLASGAGADRMSQGMSRSYGKPIGLSAQARKGKIIITAYVTETGIPAAKEALRKASAKLPMSYSIIVERLKA